MLGDTERKVLRIVSNITGFHKRPPSISEISIKSGRSPAAVRAALRILTTEKFIEWNPDRHNELKVIQAWEHNHFAKPKTIQRWWEYD